MSDLEKLKKLVIDFRDARDWKQFHNPKDLALSLVLESAEFMEHFQWKSEREVQKHLKSNKNAVSEELADVFYWVLLIANDLNIDIDAALKAKIKQNESKYPVAKAKGKHTKYTEL
jgi:NTP pyrophosphatase (non-canonical NTP hydrolase)